MNKFLKSYLLPLFNTRAAAFYMLAFACSIGIATFIENDFGTSAAQKLIFKTKWFEALLLLFSICLLVNMSRFRIIANKSWALLCFHLSMIIIFIGAGITRYYGYEGMMHIREGDEANQFLTAESYISFEAITKGNSFSFSEEVLFASMGKNRWKESYKLGDEIITCDLLEVIPNPTRVIEEDENGLPTLKIVLGGAAGREEYFIQKGEKRRIGQLNYNFSDELIDGAINLNWKNNFLYIQSNKTLSQTIMATQERDTLYPDGNPDTLRLRSLYSDGLNNFAFGDFHPQSKVKLISESKKIKNESLVGLNLLIKNQAEEKEIFIYGRKGAQGRPVDLRIGNLDLRVSYGSIFKQVPFKIKLYDFIMEKYPGTNSAASYASEVQLIDSRSNTKMDFRIYMNNILDYDGYRFFQSSFDQDERGTYLSVNRDFWGTWVSYIGYILLTLGLILSLFSKKSRFQQIIKSLHQLRSTKAIILIPFLILFGLSKLLSQKEINPEIQVPSKQHSQLFSSVIVQDFKGRMKPIHTLSRELLRKISRREEYAGQNADQVVLAMYANKAQWLHQNIIKLSKQERIKKLIGTESDYVSYADFFMTSGEYKLRDEVRRAYNSNAIDRGTYEKDLMKIDERVNIASMIFSGNVFKIIPIAEDDNNTWASAVQETHGNNNQISVVAEKFFSSYQPSLKEAIYSGDYEFCDLLISELVDYQKKISADIIPSPVKAKAEIILNQLNVFGRLSWYYFLLGITFLVLLFINVFNPELNLTKLYKLALGLLILGFIFHTFGLAVRWYISGRAPWSNGYESMIYIAWTSTLAGLLFTRRSFGGLAACMVLAGTILLVAMLSYLDPEITPLVPVLRSYWLTIHVSLIAGSYGFLMLGAIIGFVNLLLIIFLSEKNKNRIKSIVTELSYVSEITLIGGLIMISIGTYLGGVWANESWGRYWGWDAKETWALVTILVYAFILHMRLVPKLNGLYAYNLATLFGWASVIMTYFGVNYYLSGLHSYAAGDPIPIPNWVYISVATVAVVAVLAFIKKLKFNFH